MHRRFLILLLFIAAIEAPRAGASPIPCCSGFNAHANTSTFDPISGLLTWDSGFSVYGPIDIRVLAQFDPDGHLLAGFMTITGPGAGPCAGCVDSANWVVSDPGVLFIGRIVAYDLTPMGSQACAPSLPCTFEGDIQQTLDMETVYIHPLIPNWGNKASAFNIGWIRSFDEYQGPDFTRDSLFEYGWSSWSQLSIQVNSYVPEPFPLCLLGLGLAGLGLSRRCRLA